MISVIGNNPVHVGYTPSSSSATSNLILCYSTLYSAVKLNVFEVVQKTAGNCRKEERYKMAFACYCAGPLLHSAFSPRLFHLLLLVAAEAQVIVCCVDLCPANHAKHINQTRTDLSRLYRDGNLVLIVDSTSDCVP